MIFLWAQSHPTRLLPHYTQNDLSSISLKQQAHSHLTFPAVFFSELVLSSGGGVGSCGSNRTGHARLQFAVKWPSSLCSCCSWRHVHTLYPPRAVNTPNIVYPNLAHLCMLSTQDDARHYHSELDAETGQNNMVSLLSWIRGFCRERSWGKAKANA